MNVVWRKESCWRFVAGAGQFRACLNIGTVARNSRTSSTSSSSAAKRTQRLSEPFCLFPLTRMTTCPTNAPLSSGPWPWSDRSTDLRRVDSIRRPYGPETDPCDPRVVVIQLAGRMAAVALEDALLGMGAHAAVEQQQPDGRLELARGERRRRCQLAETDSYRLRSVLSAVKCGSGPLTGRSA